MTDVPGIGKVTKVTLMTVEVETPEAPHEETIEEKRLRWVEEHKADEAAFMANPLHHRLTTITQNNGGTHFSLKMDKQFTKESLIAWLNALPPGVGRVQAHRGRSWCSLDCSKYVGQEQ